ncbi:MAG: UDP-N-acetylglucosamine 1-carboxyvinyltransferase [Candidatus Paceibacterota bacterium]|jgi:UDP-N-acetylglucosamine 1-carboxyvinyltransferase
MSKNKLSQIGNLITELRERKGITQSAFGDMLGTTQSVIARIESGEQNLTTEMISKISEALDSQIVSLTKGTINFEVEGGNKLSGTVVTKTSKNGAMGIIPASLLNKGKTIIKNVPKIEEVYRMVEVLESIGVSIKWNGNDLEIEAKKISLKNINRQSAERTRSIIMLIGPLVHIFSKFSLPHSGGCKLGNRTVTPHFFALENFGIDIKTKSSSYDVSSDGLKPAEFALYESGDTVTENAIMTAALIPGKTTIKFASANYQVQDLCFFLQELGVKIDGVGTTTVTVHGVKEINKNVTYYLAEDPIETMFFISAAVITKSSITIERCPIDFLEIELLKLKKMGFKYKILKKYKALNGKTNLVDIKTFPSTLTALHDKIESRPYPGLNIDNLPYFAVIATQAKGQTLIHDWVYENRAIHYKELDKLGCDTILADPHRFYVNGKTKLKPAELICPPALRPAAIILIGMLGAEGKSILRNVYNINRGYEDIVKRLASLGAKIKILRD